MAQRRKLFFSLGECQKGVSKEGNPLSEVLSVERNLSGRMEGKSHADVQKDTVLSSTWRVSGILRGQIGRR